MARASRSIWHLSFVAAFGLLAGYYEGWWDRIVMRISDVLFAFPGILLALGITAALGPSLTNAILAIAVVNLPVFARLARSQALAGQSSTPVDITEQITTIDQAVRGDVEQVQVIAPLLLAQLVLLQLVLTQT